MVRAGLPRAQLRRCATCRASSLGGSGCGPWCARTAEGAEELGDGGRVGEDGTDGELAAASNADAKVNVESSLQQGTPVNPRGRRAKLALEDSVPVGDRQHVRGDLLGGPRRRQGSGRDTRDDVEDEGRAAVAGVMRRPARCCPRRSPLARAAPAASTCTRRRGLEEAPAPRARATDGAARARHGKRSSGLNPSPAPRAGTADGTVAPRPPRAQKAPITWAKTSGSRSTARARRARRRPRR